MKIELRKVGYSDSLSEEANAFTADVWIDGQTAGHAQNHRRGGPTNVQLNTLRVRLDAHGRTLPSVDLGSAAGLAPLVI
jgi:hypothetical protein